MNPKTEEWIKKAEGDWSTMSREFAVIDNPNHNAVCFHGQQCAEKYLKGRLFHLDIPFAKIHDVQKLLNDLLPAEPGWKFLMEAAIVLTTLAVETRYPGMDALESDAERAVEYCGMIRKTVRDAFEFQTEN